MVFTGYLIGSVLAQTPTSSEFDAEEIMGEVDAIMGLMEGYPVADIPDEFLDDNI